MRARIAVAPNALRGPAIRETAVRMLAERGGEALHYREWFELVTRAGYEIAGKHPPSVFLSQLSRSPAVRKGTRAGVYETRPPGGGAARRRNSTRCTASSAS